MSGLFRKPAGPTIIHQAPVTENDPNVREAARLQRERMKKRRGFKSTILTGPEGITSDPDLLKQRLG